MGMKLADFVLFVQFWVLIKGLPPDIGLLSVQIFPGLRGSKISGKSAEICLQTQYAIKSRSTASAQLPASAH